MGTLSLFTKGLWGTETNALLKLKKIQCLNQVDNGKALVVDLLQVQPNCWLECGKWLTSEVLTGFHKTVAQHRE